MKCPKCDYERKQKDDSATSKAECPACGIIYARYIQAIEKKRRDSEVRTLKGRNGQIYFYENGIELTKNGNKEPVKFTFAQIKDIHFRKCSSLSSGFFFVQDVNSPAYEGGVFKAVMDKNAIVFGTANPKALFCSSVCDEINKEWIELTNLIFTKIGKKEILYVDIASKGEKFNYKYSGIAALLILCFIIYIGMPAKKDKKYSVSTNVYSTTEYRFSSSTEWYQGGDLHGKSVKDWNNATYSNKLATCADMAITLPRIKKKIQESGSMDTLKPYANELMTCINNAAVAPDPRYENMSLSEIAVMCMILMKW